MRRFLGLTLATVAPLAPLHAQSVDYAALGEVFGEPVTTSVTGKPQRASDAPASITIITRDQIARSVARNVPDLLKAYAGIEVNRWTAGQSDVAVRGGVQTYNARLLVLVDGRQVYLDHYGMTDWNLLGVQLDDIQQIELVRGPGSALFGFNAASGVVNIITRSALAGAHLAATGEVGTHGYSRLGGTATLPLGETIGLKLSGGHQREEERAIPALLYQPSQVLGVRSDEASGTLTARPDGTTSIALNAGWSANRQLEFLPSQILAEQKFRSETVGLQADHDTDWGSLTGHAYTNWLRADYGITTSTSDPYRSIASLRTNSRITVVNGSALVQLGTKGTLRIGGEYRSNQLYSDQFYSSRIGYQVVAASGMLDIHPTDQLALTGAVRLDHLWLGQGGAIQQPQIDPASAYRRTITPVSFNAALTLQTSDTGRIRVNGGRGLQLPSLIDFGLRVTVPAPDVPIPVYLTGDPRLRPVTVWSAEVGYAQTVLPGFKLDGTLFFTRTENAIASPGGSVEIAVVLTPDPVAVTRFANAGAFTTYGVELTASGTLAPGLDWQANYSWTRVDEQVPANRDAIYYALFPKASTPRHGANLRLDYRAGRWFAGTLAHLMSASRQASFLPSTELALIRVPAAIDVDAKVGMIIDPHLSAYLAGENLGDARGAYGSPIPADRRLRIGLTVKL